MVQVAGILSLSAGLLLLLHGIALPGVSEAKTPRTHTGLQKGLRSTGHQRPSYQKPAAQTNPGRQAQATAQQTLASSATNSQQQSPPRYTKADILSVMPADLSRMSLVEASRSWRKGVRTYIIADQPVSEDIAAKAKLNRETWDVYTDIQKSEDMIGPRAGDLRAGLGPFIANKTLPVDSWKWMLYGDDDTVFFMDNVLKLLNELDHNVPYFISDCIWWPMNGNGTKLHPNREAPRCLPCNYKDPLLDTGGCPGHSGWIAPKACPCTPSTIFQGNWDYGEPSMADGRGLFDRQNNQFIIRPGDWNSPYQGWWYMIHGGAGAIISSAAMKRASFQDVEDFALNIPPQSGDSLTHKIFWQVMDLAPTDPGYGFCRGHIQMFDLGFKGPRTRGPEDTGTLDQGADPLGVIERLQRALGAQGTCDAECEDQLSHMISTHIRSRYAAIDLRQKEPIANPDDDGPPKYMAAVQVIEQLSQLYEQYSSKHTDRAHYVPLWTD